MQLNVFKSHPEIAHLSCEQGWSLNTVHFLLMSQCETLLKVPLLIMLMRLEGIYSSVSKNILINMYTILFMQFIALWKEFIIQLI